MLRSRLFWKLFGSYVVLSAMAAVAIYFVMAQRRQTEAESQVERRLAELSAALEPVAGDVFNQRLTTAKFQSRADQLAEISQARITLIDNEGVVLADTQYVAADMENHFDRPEVQQSLNTQVGTSRRESDTLGFAMLYFARRVGSEGETSGFIRVAFPLTDVEAFIGEQTAPLVGVVMALSLFGLLAAYWMVSRILRPVAELEQAASAIAQGEPASVPSTQRNDELGRLAEAFRRMNKQLEKRMRQLQQRATELAAVLGGMAEGVIAIDEQHHILFVNDAAATLLNLTEHNVRRRPLWEIVRHPSVQQTVHECVSKLTPQRTEFETIDGPPQQIELTVIPMPGEPSPGFVLGFHDVSELRRLERLRSEFVANVSHELKTPLAAILACAETLRSGAIDDREHAIEFVQSIERQGERLEQLIIDLLSLARIEAGEEPFEIGPESARDAAQECASHYEAQAAAKSVSLVVDQIDPELHVLADAEGLRQILDNLVDNAIKYSRENGNVTIRWTADSRADDMTVLEVEDTGIGIAHADQQRIFERFYRADKARSRQLGGTGLGLSIVKHVAQAFGGSVGLRSEPGQGSVFVVRLPAAECE